MITRPLPAPLADAVVFDTPAVLHLDRIGHLPLLQRLFRRVAVPNAVRAEIDEGLRRGYAGPNLVSV